MNLASMPLRQLSLVVPLLLVGGQFASAQQTFEYKAKAGDKHIYRTTTLSKSEQKVAGQNLKTEFTQTAIGVRTYKEANEDGNLRFDVETKHLSVNMALPGLGKFKFDSAAKDNESGSQVADALTPMYEALSTAKLGVTHTVLGKVEDVSGYAELMKEVLKNNPIASQFAAGGSDEVAKAGMSELLIPFKKDGVNPGDEWEDEVKMKLPKLGEGIGKKTIRFDGDDKVGDTPTKKFTVTVEIKMDININQGGAKVTGTIESESSSGEYHFDPAIGQLILGKMKQTLSGTLTATVGGNTVEVGISQTQDVKLERLDKLPEAESAKTESTTDSESE